MFFGKINCQDGIRVEEVPDGKINLTEVLVAVY